MEIILLSLFIFLAWRFLRKKGYIGILRKADAASSLERLLRIAARKTGSNNDKSFGDLTYEYAAQRLIEDVWHKMPSIFSKGSKSTPHKISTICTSLALAVQSTRKEDESRVVYLMALCIAIDEASKYITSEFSETDHILLERNTQIFLTETAEHGHLDIAVNESSARKNLSSADGRFMGSETDEDEREAYQGEAMLRAHESGATIQEALAIHDAIGKLYDQKKIKQKT